MDAYNNIPWQATKKCWQERMGFLYENQALADVLFRIEFKDEITEIRAHKFVLTVGSPVFDTMFNGSVASSLENVTIETERGLKTVQQVTISDISPKVFKNMLRYLYLDEINLDNKSVVDIIYCAKKYDIPLLESTGEEFLKHTLSSENACLLLTQAILFDMKELATACMSIIENDTTTALNGENITYLDLSTLKNIIKTDSLVISELELFQAVERWVEAEILRRKLPISYESKREVLGDAIYLIRFPLMSINDFGKYVATSGLLSNEESFNMFLYYTVDDNNKPKIPFPTTPRQPQLNLDFLKHNESNSFYNLLMSPKSNYVELRPNSSGFVYNTPAYIFQAPPPKYISGQASSLNKGLTVNYPHSYHIQQQSSRNDAFNQGFAVPSKK
uniref:BTB domain-containing protein n=1 Tax=Acrobeloides nanus TaxID=290746 RepID=A0A914DLE7_9BILA